MHEASFEKMRAFRSAYVTPRDCSIRVLDVGAGTGEEALSYSALFEPPDFKYVGLDYAHGPNVDVVPADPFSWDELETEGFDLVLLGKTVEHTPFFWITAAEVARVLVPGGLVAIIAPSAGRVHRLPLDCWRFYPDSWPALCAYVGLDLAESFIDYPAKDRPIGGQAWNDAMMVGRKPDPGPGYYDRLAAIVATRPIDRILSEPAPGPAAEAYRAAHTLDHPALTALNSSSSTTHPADCGHCGRGSRPTFAPSPVRGASRPYPGRMSNRSSKRKIDERKPAPGDWRWIGGEPPHPRSPRLGHQR